jgi:hypothetical protein
MIEQVTNSNPNANIVFVLNEEGIVESHTITGEKGCVDHYDKRNGYLKNRPEFHIESYNGLTAYYERALSNLAIERLEKEYKYKNTIIFGSISAAIVISMLIIALLYSHGV